MDDSSSFENPYGKQDAFAPYGDSFGNREPTRRKVGETVMAILFFVLTGVIVVSLIWISFNYSKNIRGNSDLRTTHKLIDDIDLAIYEYRTSHGQWPPSLDRLEKHYFGDVLSREGRALDKLPRVDSWGNPIKLTFDVAGKWAPHIQSAGPDGEFETLDDIQRQSAW